MSRTTAETPVVEPIPLSAATDVAVAGGKAAALAVAIAHGYRVPDGVVLPVVTAPADDELGSALAGLVERLGGSVAVRSSAVGEDSAAASYAGQYESVLSVESDESLRQAIRTCRSSARSAAVRSYAEHAHDRDGEIAVLVQSMVRPTAAGVAFSIDPVTGDEHVVIEATTGLGDALLAGEVTGERWTVRTGTRPSVESDGGGDSEGDSEGDGESVLTESEAREVAELCHSLAVDTGGPIDIEWAFEDGALFLLQARPVTVVPIEPTDRPPDGQTFVREPRFDGPIKPLSFTAWLPRHGRAFTHTFARFGLPLETIDNRHYLGRIYSRAVQTIDRGKDGPPPPLPILQAMFRFLPPMRRRMRSALEWNGDEAIDALIDAWENDGRDRTRRRSAELRDRDLTSMSDDALAGHLEEVGRHIVEVAEDHFDLAIGAVYIPMGRLGMFVEAQLDWSMHDIFTLVQGYSGATTAHGDAIRRLIDVLGQDGVDAALSDPATLLVDPAGRAYIEAWGHRCDIDLSSPTEAEDPSLIAAHVRRHLRVSRSTADPAEAAHEAEAAARAELPASARADFTRILRLARRGRPYGDETEGTVLEALAGVRPAALESARRFVADGRLDDTDDIWFVEESELLAMLRSTDVGAPDVTRRRGEYQWALANPAPDHLGPEPPPPLSARVAPPRYRDSVGAVLWAVAASQPDPVVTDGSAADGGLHGIPGSPGVVEGPVRIIRDPSGFAAVEPGDVVVCPITQASWSPIFDVIGGLVTEQGGPLSHPGTLAREYGLPCVLSVGGATSKLTEGTLVRLDGAAGTVTQADS